MNRMCLLLALAAFSAPTLSAQRPAFDQFEVATIKPTNSDAVSTSSYIRMESTNRFYAKNETLKQLIAAAYSLNPKQITGGPTWLDADHYDTVAQTPGQAKPTTDEQMTMLRKLLGDRFQLAFHWEQKQMPIYLLTTVKSGSKLTESTAPSDEQPSLINVVYSDHIKLPAKNATITQFTWMLRRAVLDRPVVDHTGLTGRYDFTLEWMPDSTQFGGQLTLKPNPQNPEPSLYAALQEQLGLHLEATKGPAEVLIIDRVQRPSVN